MEHSQTILGLGDGGAHLGTICDASFTTHMLTHWARDRRRGRKLPVETVVKWHSRDTARAMGLFDRGVLKLAIGRISISSTSTGCGSVHRACSALPAGGQRLMQDAEGYRYAIVAGQVTTGMGWLRALPGRLVRGLSLARAEHRGRGHAYRSPHGGGGRRSGAGG